MSRSSTVLSLVKVLYRSGPLGRWTIQILSAVVMAGVVVGMVVMSGVPWEMISPPVQGAMGIIIGMALVFLLHPLEAKGSTTPARASSEDLVAALHTPGATRGRSKLR